MKKTLAEIAAFIGAEVRGDASQIVTGIATLQNAQPGQITFLDNIKYRNYLAETKASAVILSPEMAQQCHVSALISPNPYLGYARVAAMFDRAPASVPGIHVSAVIGENCHIDPTASIGPQAVIGSDVVIGEYVIIGPGCVVGANTEIAAATHLWANVTIYHGVRIGKRVIIHSGAVIGSDGFGIAKDKGIWHKIPQIGGVIIGDDVEIGANTAIDRGALDDTIIEEGVKLDNQIQIGHNVRIGAHTAIAGCVGIAGSTTIGKRCGIGGGVGIIGHLTIADDVMITAGTGVSKSITESGIYSSGIDAKPASLWRRILARIHQLDETGRKLHELEKQFNELKRQIKQEELT